MRSIRRLKLSVPWIVLLVGIILLPIIISSNYVLSVMVFVGIYGALAISLGILIGHAGLFSLAQPTWFGLGAYVSGILAAREIMSPWMGIIVSAILVAMISYVVGVQVLRLRGYYLACATFGILIIGEIAFTQLGDITGGHSGLLGIPPLTIGNFVFQSNLHYYFLSWALCSACLWFFSNIINSRIGRAIRASHDSENASETVGINVPKYRLQVFVLTSVVTSFAGGILCFYIRFAAPSIFGFALLVQVILMVVIGGMGNLWGYLLGSFIIIWLGELLNLYLGKILPVMTAEVEALFFGVLVIVMLIFMPRGIAGWITQLYSRM